MDQKDWGWTRYSQSHSGKGLNFHDPDHCKWGAAAHKLAIIMIIKYNITESEENQN